MSSKFEKTCIFSVPICALQSKTYPPSCKAHLYPNCCSTTAHQLKQALQLFLTLFFASIIFLLQNFIGQFLLTSFWVHWFITTVNFQRICLLLFVLCADVNFIETYIDYKKLQFFGQICRLPCWFLLKRFWNI